MKQELLMNIVYLHAVCIRYTCVCVYGMVMKIQKEKSLFISNETEHRFHISFIIF